MTGKVVEVIALILDGMNKNIPIEEVSHKISINKTYDKQTISAAFSLVYDKVLSPQIAKRKGEKSISFRILTDEEKDFIGQENFNYITHLNAIGLLDNLDFELFMEQLLLYPKEDITRDDINWLVLVSLVDLEVDLLPGSRVLLFSTDTIN